MSGSDDFDLIVIGGGPGGYTAAARASRLGFRVACVEREQRLGGVCLNVGCIPSKALLDSSEMVHLAKHRLSEFGVTAGGVEFDLKAMMSRKDGIIESLASGVRVLLEAGSVTIIHGTARLSGRNGVQVQGGESTGGASRELTARSILLAAGSEPVQIPSAPFDGSRIVSSTEALSFDSVPEHLVIIGGGYIGLELGSVWNRLGSRVTVLEMLPKIASGLDGQIGRALQRSLAKQGLVFRLETRVSRATTRETGVLVELEGNGSAESIECDRLLVAVGRKPLTRGLGLREAGVELDGAGRVIVDSSFRTSNPAVLAIGDLIAGPMLAHKASAEGIAAVEIMAGLPSEVNYDAIPAVVYTSPEVATVGKTEEQLKERGIEFQSGVFPFAGTGRAKCLGETEGFAKILAHARTDRVLGAHVIGPRASELIAECVLGMEYNASAEDIARTVHAHPTLSEAISDSAWALIQRST